MRPPDSREPGPSPGASAGHAAPGPDRSRVLLVGPAAARLRAPAIAAVARFGPSRAARARRGPAPCTRPELKFSLIDLRCPLVLRPRLLPDSARGRDPEREGPLDGGTADAAAFKAIAARSAWRPDAFTDPQRLAIYQLWKVTQAIALDPIGNDTFRFDFLARPAQAMEPREFGPPAPSASRPRVRRTAGAGRRPDLPDLSRARHAHRGAIGRGSRRGSADRRSRLDTRERGRCRRRSSSRSDPPSRRSTIRSFVSSSRMVGRSRPHPATRSPTGGRRVAAAR